MPNGTFDVYHCDGSNIDASDFTFLSGSGGTYTVDESGDVDTVTTQTVGLGDYSVKRITITFDDGNGNGIANTWLQVTVEDNGDVGVADDHVFYFGSLVADMSGSSGPDLMVGSDDLDVVRNNWGAGSPDGFDDGDVNLDDSVNSDDLDAVRGNWGATLSTPFSGSRPSSSSQTAWTSEADDVFRKYGLLDDDSSNDLAIDADFWDDLYKALGLPVL